MCKRYTVSIGMVTPFYEAVSVLDVLMVSLFQCTDSKQFLYFSAVCIRGCGSCDSSTGHRASVETLAMCGSNYPFKYELPHTYSHFISSAEGCPVLSVIWRGCSLFVAPAKPHNWQWAASLSSWHYQCQSTKKWALWCCGCTQVAMVVTFQGSLF